MLILRNPVNEEDVVLVDSLFLRQLVFFKNQVQVFLQHIPKYFELRDQNFEPNN